MIDVADRDRAVVAVVERGGHAGREHEHAGHLHQGQQPEGHVVGVERRCEPGVVHPRPPDREEHLQEGHERVERVAVGDRVGEAARQGATATTNVRSNSSSSWLDGAVRLVDRARRHADADGSGTFHGGPDERHAFVTAGRCHRRAAVWSCE